MKKRSLAFCVVAFGSLLHVSQVEAQLVPLSEESVVNSYTTGRQAAPAVAADAIGNYIVVWESAAGTSAGQQAVRGRRFTAAGVPLGQEFQVGTRSSTHGAYPAVAMASDGSFVVVWRDYDDDSYPRIVARAFESSGAPRGQAGFVDEGPEVGGVWSYSYYYAGAPAAVSGQDGRFVVVWSGGLKYLSYFGYSRYFSIRGRDLAPNGEPSGDEFHVGGGLSWSRDPDIAQQEPGEFVVVWSEASYEYYHDDSNDYVRVRHFDVRGRAVDQAGVTIADTFEVGPGDGYVGASVATDSAGNFIVAWPRFDDTNGYSLLARLFDTNAQPTADEFRVDTGATGTVGQPTSAGADGAEVAMTGDGHFTVVWSEGGDAYEGNSDGDAAGIFARTYNPDGSAQSAEVLVNSYTTGSQQTPAVAFANDQTLVVTWQSEGRDGSDSAIAARRLSRAAACGDATADGQVSATDALFALQAAVGVLECAGCVCDTDDSGVVTVLDALVILQSALGGGSVVLNCPACS